MGNDPRSSVVNEAGRHHHLANLSVHDGSVFPTSIGANPQLSIYALAARQHDGKRVVVRRAVAALESDSVAHGRSFRNGGSEGIRWSRDGAPRSTPWGPWRRSPRRVRNTAGGTSDYTDGVSRP